MSICTIDGQIHNVGDTEEPVVIDSCCRPINYALALNQIGEDIVSQYLSNGALVKNDDIDKVCFSNFFPKIFHYSLDYPSCLFWICFNIILDEWLSIVKPVCKLPYNNVFNFYCIFNLNFQ